MEEKIKFYNGDLLDSTAGIIAHQVNARGVMGSGVALAIKTKYPEVFKSYREFFETGNLKLGKVDFAKTNDGKIVANIKHGITKDYLPRMLYSKTRYNLLVCGASPEARYFQSALGYPADVAQYTGFCRFDRLLEFQTKRQILVMPTYRKYIQESDLADSLFVKTYCSLLANSTLAEMLDKNDVNLIFYPHHKFQPFVDQFRHQYSPRHLCCWHFR